MTDGKNMTLGVLAITATILLVGIVLTHTGTQNQALAFGQLDRGGDYVILTGQFTDNTELVYITDAAARKLNVYSYETTIRQFVMWDSVDLTRITGVRSRK